MSKKILFFCRDYQIDLFAKVSESINAECFYFTFLKSEKKRLKEKFQIESEFCFEEYFENNRDNFSDLIDFEFQTSFLSDRFWSGLDMKIRRQILALEIEFIRNVFNSIKPDYLLNEVVAIEFSEILEIEAKKRGIQYLAWLVTPFKDRCFYWLDNPFNGEIKNLNEHIPSIEDEIFAKKFINDFREKENVKPFYAQKKIHLWSISFLLSNLKYIIITLVNFYYYIKCSNNKIFKKYYCGDFSQVFNYIQSCKNSLFYRYNEIDQINNFEIVFYPLHFEPEASIIYMSEFHEDQVSLIRNFSKCIGINQVLAVKEHPQQPGMLLTNKYIKLRNEISNLIYLPANISTKNVISKASIVVTQTSTAGLEALILKKPVIVLGLISYNIVKGINLFKSFETLKKIIRTKELTIVNDLDLIYYISRFYSLSQKGNIYFNKNIYNNENIINISKSINRKIGND